MTHLAWWPFIVLAGAGVGICTGLFGVGGSSVATPVLALLGTHGLIAVAAPLPATIPSAAVGAIPYVRSREARPHAAAWSILGGIPGTVAGALLSHMVGGPVLLIVSGLVLIAVGLRVILPIDEAALEKGAERRHHRAQLVATMALTGVFTGLLANGGGFLIVPLYLLIFGLRMREAVGTSLLVITVLAIPTLITHWLLGHINWAVAGEFALGQVPGSAVGSQFAHHVQGPVIRRAFGWFLIAFGLFFTIDRIVAHGGLPPSARSRVIRCSPPITHRYARGSPQRSVRAARGLTSGPSLELLRTRVLLKRFLPAPPARVLDVGGASGVYASWLSGRGYQVHLIDPVPLHREQAMADGWFSVAPGDARSLAEGDGSYDAVLLLGPLYHLTERTDRVRALAEARRVTRPGGIVAAEVISR